MTNTIKAKEKDHHLPKHNKYRSVEKKGGEGAHNFGSIQQTIHDELEEHSEAMHHEPPSHLQVKLREKETIAVEETSASNTSGNEKQT